MFAMPAALPTRAFGIPGSRERCSEKQRLGSFYVSLCSGVSVEHANRHAGCCARFSSVVLALCLAVLFVFETLRFTTYSDSNPYSDSDPMSDLCSASGCMSASNSDELLAFHNQIHIQIAVCLRAQVHVTFKILACVTI